MLPSIESATLFLAIPTTPITEKGKRKIAPPPFKPLLSHPTKRKAGAQTWEKPAMFHVKHVREVSFEPFRFCEAMK